MRIWKKKIVHRIISEQHLWKQITVFENSRLKSMKKKNGIEDSKPLREKQQDLKDAK